MSQPSNIINKEQFRQHMYDAVEVLCEPVVATLGPEGLPILIERQKEPPLSTKDGVTVAKHINVADRAMNVVIQAMKECSIKTNEEAGDGTTTSILLTKAFIHEGIKYINSKAITAQELVQGIRGLEADILKKLDDMATPISTDKEQENVARISANNDEEIALGIVEALDLAGDYGYIDVIDGTSRETQVKFIEGYTLASGWSRLGPHGITFVTHRDKGTVELIKPAILLYDGPLSDMNDLVTFYNALAGGDDGLIRDVPFLIIAYSFEGQAYELLMLNKRRGGLSVAPLVIPILGSPNIRRYMLEDLAILTGATVINHDAKGLTQNALELTPGNRYKVKEGILGSCAKVVINKRDSIIYGGYGDEEEIKSHLKILDQQQKDAESDYERDLTKTRMGKMVGGVVEIQVGGSTELELKEKKFRAEDALNATRAAIELGVVPGGGIALFDIASKSPQDSIPQKVVAEALQYPLKQILINAGISPDVILYNIQKAQLLKEASSESSPTTYAGYDARNKYMIDDMLSVGIIDPVKVTKLAFKNALSIACELLLGGGMICLVPKQSNSKMSGEDMRPDLYLNEDENQEI